MAVVVYEKARSVLMSKRRKDATLTVVYTLHPDPQGDPTIVGNHFEWMRHIGVEAFASRHSRSLVSDRLYRGIDCPALPLCRRLVTVRDLIDKAIPTALNNDPQVLKGPFTISKGPSRNIRTWD